MTSYSPLQLRVRDLTNNDPWGCSPSDMQFICDELEFYSSRDEILEVLKERWEDNTSTWRNIYKSLVLFEYLLLHMSLKCLEQILVNRELHERKLEELSFYEFLESQGKDQGLNVRTRAAAILNLLKNSADLDHARQKAAEGKKTIASKKKWVEVESKFSSGLVKNQTPSTEPLANARSGESFSEEKHESYQLKSRMRLDSTVDFKRQSRQDQTHKITTDLLVEPNYEKLEPNNDMEEFDEFQMAQVFDCKEKFLEDTLQKSKNRAKATSSSNDLMDFGCGAV